jgi:hypothetical protein
MANLRTRKTKPKLGRAFWASYWRYDREAVRARMTMVERAAKLLPRTYCVMRFTPAQMRRIKRAAKASGSEGAPIWYARGLLLGCLPKGRDQC